MRITFDAAKRDKTLAQRGLDFADAGLVFNGVTLEVEDDRHVTAKCESSAMASWPDAWLSSDTHRVARTVTSLA